MDEKKLTTLEKLIKRFEASNLQSLEVSTKELSVKMSLPQMQTSPSIPTQAPITTNQTQPSPKNTIKSPMVGTIFLAASPESGPFIKVGEKVEKGATLCLIEAMKTFTPIVAENSAIIEDILVKNGQAVEFNQDLIAIES